MGVFLVVLGGIFWAVSGVLAEYLFENHYSVEWVSFYRLFLHRNFADYRKFKAF